MVTTVLHINQLMHCGHFSSPFFLLPKISFFIHFIKQMFVTCYGSLITTVFTCTCYSSNLISGEIF